MLIYEIISVQNSVAPTDKKIEMMRYHQNSVPPAGQKNKDNLLW